MRICTITGDSVDNSIENAKISMENARSSLENAQETLDDYSITAPISGEVVTKTAKAGDKIEGGSDGTLCVIYDLSCLEMTMSIDELDISDVAVGQEVQITADAVRAPPIPVWSPRSPWQEPPPAASPPIPSRSGSTRPKDCVPV